MPIFLEEFRMKEQSRGRKNVGTLGHLSFKREEEIGSEQKSGNFHSSCTQCCRRYMEANRNKKTHLAVHLKRTGFDFSLSCIGEGNDNPLQCSCLENPRDGGTWWAPVYGVVQSQTRLKRLSSSSSNDP